MHWESTTIQTSLWAIARGKNPLSSAQNARKLALQASCLSSLAVQAALTWATLPWQALQLPNILSHHRARAWSTPSTQASQSTPAARFYSISRSSPWATSVAYNTRTSRALAEAASWPCSVITSSRWKGTRKWRIRRVIWASFSSVI